MILCFDTETTSLNPGQICQLSYVMQEGKVIKSRNLFFTVDKVDYSAYLVHGFSVEKLQALSGGKRFSDYIDLISEDFSKADVVVSHNVSFDLMFMRAEFERLNRVFTFKQEFCTMKKCTPVCKLQRKSGTGYKYPKLAELCEHFCISEKRIGEISEKLFGFKSDFHDARFDTTALFLALNYGVQNCEEFKQLKQYI